ncbi:MAG: DUF2520 domain-containing protein [Bacteroidales bacterium]|jgi:predicted short-subunit dehydrogenase-like oxidoreductase (DUF2520 family)|nr:DUF2520 domain-containing protein [Bacteroidales bacterium]
MKRLEKEIQDIVVIGSGNVAYHLICAFTGIGISVSQLYSRNEKTASFLSGKFGIPYIGDPNLLNRDAGLYILAVQDSNIREAAMSLNLEDHLLVHTSGFSPLGILEGTAALTGVIWPVQTFTSGKDTDYRNIPLFVEGSDIETGLALKTLAGRISRKVVLTDTPTRQWVHLAAVVSSNLVNHLYSVSASILESVNLPFDVLHPLIHETAKKAMATLPSDAQTGPAARNDMEVIRQHLEMLRDKPLQHDIYQLITNSILNPGPDKHEKL